MMRTGALGPSQKAVARSNLAAGELHRYPQQGSGELWLRSQSITV